jgi:Mor family transcriptional regulator
VSRKLTGAEEAEAVRLYESGKTCKEVGEILGASRGYISSVLNRRGVELRPRGWSTKGHMVALTRSQEAEACERYLAGESGKALGRAFEVSDTTIYKALNRNGIKSRSLSIFTEAEERAICGRYEAGEHISSLASHFGVRTETMWQIIRRRGTRMRRPNELGIKYQCDHSFFDCIDTEEKAYVLGFVAADGYVHNAEDRISISLQPADKEHLVRLKYALKSTHPIAEYSSFDRYHDKITTTATLSIGSSKLVRALEAHGVGRKKTFGLRWPTLSDDLQRHYVRGIVDGDGSFWAKAYKEHNGRTWKQNYGFSITANRTFLLECQRYLMRECGLNLTKLDHKKGTDTRIATLRYGGRQQVKRIFRFLYDDASIFLLRKYYGLHSHFEG